MMVSISEDGSKAKPAKTIIELPHYSRSVSDSKAAYSTMSSKGRGESCHKGSPGPQKTRELRDCTAWFREDKQYHPHSTFESPGNGPKPKAKRSGVPPPLWLPQDPRAPAPKNRSKTLATGVDHLPLGAEAGEDAADIEPVKSGVGLEDRAPWDTEHHIMHSRMNHEVRAGTREYFDRAVKKEGVGVPKVREQYIMNDRQCCWNDEPAPMGESRHTMWDNIGLPRDQQLPSYWRKVGDWKSFSTPDLHISVSRDGKPKEKPPSARKAMLLALADLPADQSKEFWKGWMEQKTGKGELPPPNRWDKPFGWDDRWNVGPSKGNHELNPRLREYFAVTQGANGKEIERKRPSLSPKGRRRAVAISEKKKS